MKHLFKLLAISLVLTSCYSNKKLTYLQDSKTMSQFNTDHSDYLLQSNDIISIVVKSLDPTNSELFNLQTHQNYGNITGQSMFLAGYTIDNEGFVRLPIVGKVNVSNMNIRNAESLIQTEVDKYLRNATVIVKMVSFKVAVLGEVRTPGYYYVFNAKANIFEGLGMAGDITQTGNHKNVRLIRQSGDKTEIHILDLTTTNILESPNFYLLPNDILYVEPLRARNTQTNVQLWSQILSVVLAGINTYIIVTKL